MDIVIYLFDGEPGSLILTATVKLGLPELKVSIRLLRFRKNLLPDTALPASGPELVFDYATLGHGG